MSKKIEEVNNSSSELEFEVNDSFEDTMQLTEVQPVVKESSNITKSKNNSAKVIESEPVINCLRNERLIVRYIPKLSGMWGNNPKHILSGGMAEGAVRTFVVPKLSSGMYVNILTDKEKEFLEEVMGLEYNALSIYKKVDNYWDDRNESSVNKVRLTKGDNFLNLADPEDYIRYKILLANKDLIAPSLQILQDKPKITYQFVIISEGDEAKIAKTNMSSTMLSYKEFGKIEDDIDILRTIIETIDGRPVSPSSKLEFLQTKINTLIQTDSKLFLRVVTDPLLSTKVLIKKAITAGLISNRGTYLYLRADNSPLCELNEEPTLNTAAKFLNTPKHQEVKFTLEAKLKD